MIRNIGSVMNGQFVSYPVMGRLQLMRTSTRTKRPLYFDDLMYKAVTPLYEVCYLIDMTKKGQLYRQFCRGIINLHTTLISDEIKDQNKLQRQIVTKCGFIRTKQASFHPVSCFCVSHLVTPYILRYSIVQPGQQLTSITFWITRTGKYEITASLIGQRNAVT